MMKTNRVRLPNHLTISVYDRRKKVYLITEGKTNRRTIDLGYESTPGRF